MSEFINIKWQDGPVRENGVNGAQIEDVIRVLISRLQTLNVPPFECEQDYAALACLQMALGCLMQRTADRITRGVEGTLEP